MSRVTAVTAVFCEWTPHIVLYMHANRTCISFCLFIQLLKMYHFNPAYVISDCEVKHTDTLCMLRSCPTYILFVYVQCHLPPNTLFILPVIQSFTLFPSSSSSRPLFHTTPSISDQTHPSVFLLFCSATALRIPLRLSRTHLR